MKNKWQRFCDWIQWSSANPENLSMTFKGMAIGFIPVLLITLKALGIENIASSDLQTLIDLIGNSLFSLFTALSAIITLVGFVRKVKISIFG